MGASTLMLSMVLGEDIMDEIRQECALNGGADAEVAGTLLAHTLQSQLPTPPPSPTPEQGTKKIVAGVNYASSRWSQRFKLPLSVCLPPDTVSDSQKSRSSLEELPDDVLLIILQYLHQSPTPSQSTSFDPRSLVLASKYLANRYASLWCQAISVLPRSRRFTLDRLSPPRFTQMLLPSKASQKEGSPFAENNIEDSTEDARFVRSGFKRRRLS